MIVKDQRKIELINTCEAIYDEKELISAILWRAEKPVSRIKHVYMHGEYPAISIYGEKIHIHRLLMLYWNKGKIENGYVVHHINENKKDSSKNNLLLVKSSVHLSEHNKGKPKNNGKKVAIANHKRKGIRHKPTRPEITPETVYKMKKDGMSFNKISKELGLDWGCVKQRYNDFVFDNPELLGGTE